MAEVTKNSKIKSKAITPNLRTDTGINIAGLYKLQIGSISYDNPLYFILTFAGIEVINTTWYSSLMDWEVIDGSLYLTYNTNNNALLYFTLLE